MDTERFWGEGYLVVPGLAGADLLGRLRGVAEAELGAGAGAVEYEAELGYPGAPSLDGEGAGTVRRLLQVYARDGVFRDWALGSEVKGALAALFGGGEALAVSQCHHNCVMTKAPGFSSATGWHRDIRYWAFARPELISAWLALGREEEANGCLRVIPGSHRLELEPGRFDEAQFLRPELAENERLVEQAVPVELEAGDCLFFHCRLLHSAGRNLTDKVKYSLVFAYHQVGNEAVAGTRSAGLPSVAL